MQELSFELFEPLVGSTFQIMVQGQPSLDLKLASVEDMTVEDLLRDPSIRSQPFSLIFDGPMTPVAPQAIYELNHDQLEKLNLFLVPIGPDRKTRQVMQYQAIFN